MGVPRVSHAAVIMLGVFDQYLLALHLLQYIILGDFVATFIIKLILLLIIGFEHSFELFRDSVVIITLFILMHFLDSDSILLLPNPLPIVHKPLVLFPEQVHPLLSLFLFRCYLTINDVIFGVWLDVVGHGHGGEGGLHGVDVLELLLLLLLVDVCGC